jgi:hypothetical protein
MLTPNKIYNVNVVGESHYQAAVARLFEGERVHFVHDAKYKFDPRAVAVVSSRKEIIGYLERGSWLSAAMLDEGRSCSAKVSRLHKRANGGPHTAVILAVTLE